MYFDSSSRSLCCPLAPQERYLSVTWGGTGEFFPLSYGKPVESGSISLVPASSWWFPLSSVLGTENCFGEIAVSSCFNLNLMIINISYQIFCTNGWWTYYQYLWIRIYKSREFYELYVAFQDFWIGEALSVYKAYTLGLSYSGSPLKSFWRCFLMS